MVASETRFKVLSIGPEQVGYISKSEDKQLMVKKKWTEQKTERKDKDNGQGTRTRITNKATDRAQVKGQRTGHKYKDNGQGTSKRTTDRAQGQGQRTGHKY